MQLLSEFIESDMFKHHSTCADERAWIGVLCPSLLHHSWGTPVDRLKHGRLFADVCTASGSDTALNLGCLVSQDIAVEIGHHEHLKILLTRWIYQCCGHDVDVPAIPLYIRIPLRDLATKIQKLTVGCFDDVCFRDDCYFSSAGTFCVGKGCLDNPLRSLAGDNAKIYAQIIGDIDTLASKRIHIFSVFTEEGPVNIFGRNAHRTDIGE